jgi:hypothetical protein
VACNTATKADNEGTLTILKEYHEQNNKMWPHSKFFEISQKIPRGSVSLWFRAADRPLGCQDRNACLRKSGCPKIQPETNRRPRLRASDPCTRCKANPKLGTFGE